jgi:hypothetical protein
MSRKSIFEELNNYVPKRNTHEVIESRANHLITSIINLMETVYENYSQEEAELLEKKILNSIRSKDASKMERAFHKVKEGKQ